jgi:hypothetical protein
MWGDLMSEAEDGLIEAVRTPKAGDFTLTITCEENRWHVRYADAGKVKNGYGISFDEAWNDMMMPVPQHRNIAGAP